MSPHKTTRAQSFESYWPFVHCSVCFLPFFSSGSPSDPPPVPFWLTDCGHVVCNSHLNPDQSCASCHAPNIRPVPLQLPSESSSMTDWHLLLPRALSQLTRTAQYQHESSAALIAHLQDRCRAQAGVLEKVKMELENMMVLKRDFETLQQENAQLRAQLGYPPANRPQNQQNQDTQHYQQMPVDPPLNVNGKRPHPEQHQPVMRPRTAGLSSSSGRRSSPRSAPMPMQPDRLTLPGQEQGAGVGVRALDRNNTETPRLEKFAYQPPSTPRSFAPPLQMQHTHHRSHREQQQQQPAPFPQHQQSRHEHPMHGDMPPPPVPQSRRTGGAVREMPSGAPPPSRTAFRPLQPTPRPNATPHPFQPQPRYAQPTPRNPLHHQNQQHQQPFYPSTNLPNLTSGFGAPPTPQVDRFGTAQRGKRFVPAGDGGARGGNGGTASRAGWMRASEMQ